MSISKDSSAQPDPQMEKLRELILGENNQRVKQTVDDNAREIVSKVLTEALHDRQESDSSVSRILTPLVEKSVEASVNDRKEQFVGYLYPLVGSLVRKSVSAFVAGLMERTNELLESSFTYKGLKWRLKAWQAGVSYSQYVVSQTFLFRVEQVLLIHRETGLLLKTVSRDKTQTTDADMVSAMLTAINDFVSDSFHAETDAQSQNLDEIKTDDFTLLIKQGPQAILVAAVTGNAPASLGDTLQLALEDIHRIYGKALKSFTGDASLFENTEQTMNACLLSQHKQEQEKRPVPWKAFLVIIALFTAMGYVLIPHWRLNYLAEQVQKLETPPGITLLKAARCQQAICVELLRDPLAQKSKDWLVAYGFSANELKLIEHTYHSYEAELIEARLVQVANMFNGLSYQNSPTGFAGQLSGLDYQKVKDRLASLVDEIELEKLLKNVAISQPKVSELKVNKLLLQQLINDIENVKIDFDSNESVLNSSARASLVILSEQLIQLSNLMADTNQHLQVVVMGTSDPIGSAQYNQELSTKRANAVISELIILGVSPELIRSVGLGIVSTDTAHRRVLLSVLKL